VFSFLFTTIFGQYTRQKNCNPISGSAAETQEFLIQRKDDPAQAVEDVGK
jgi:hypothetical protein